MSIIHTRVILVKPIVSMNNECEPISSEILQGSFTKSQHSLAVVLIWRLNLTAAFPRRR